MSLRLTAALCLLPGAALSQDVWPLTEDLGFKVYGQINQAYMNYDDGAESRGFLTVDNRTNLDGSFVGFRMGRAMDNGGTFGGRVELDLPLRDSLEVSLHTPAGKGVEFDAEDIRRAEVAFAHGFGRVFFGQGDMSANLWATDYSGTQVITGPNVAQIAGAMLLRNEDGTLSDRRISDAVGTFDSGQRFRLRYDSPDLSGFTFSASVGREVLTSGDNDTYLDLATKYQGTSRFWDYSASISVTGIGDSEYAGIASFAWLHKTTGLNLTFTGTHSTTDRHYFFFKAGLIRNIFGIGATAVSLDWYNNGNWAAEGSEDETFGVSLVQNVDAHNLQVYATLRSFDNYNNLNIATENFQKAEAIAAGLRWQF